MSSPEVSGLPSQMGFLTYHCQRLTFEVAAFFCFFHVHIQIQRVSPGSLTMMNPRFNQGAYVV